MLLSPERMATIGVPIELSKLSGLFAIDARMSWRQMGFNYSFLDEWFVYAIVAGTSWRQLAFQVSFSRCSRLCMLLTLERFGDNWGSKQFFNIVKFVYAIDAEMSWRR